MYDLIFSSQGFRSISNETADELELHLFGTLKLNRIKSSSLTLDSCYMASFSAVSSSFTHAREYCYREASLYCYWIIKRKPFYWPDPSVSGDLSLRLNELLGYRIAVKVVDHWQAKILTHLEDDGRPAEAQKMEEIRTRNVMRAVRLEERVSQNLQDYDFSACSIAMLLESQFDMTLERAKAKPSISPDVA